ncbi:MAG: type I-G CRISPR-associated helicase/endonuclease Cas3g [Isosphaeraceae bacterium]
MSDGLDFDDSFRALTGNDPFPWQRAMYRRIVEGDPPKSCQIPTGLGKTSVMAIWLIALARNPGSVPRRLVYVVNRRTVVDQSTREAETLKANLAKLEDLPPAFDSLAISTLRGQFADNREWSADPSRPAIIAGTVDMIGSRLLFSGYGIGFKLRPLHAGFLGQDVLLVHDEAHLEPAFQKLLVEIEREQEDRDFRPLRVMELSATSREGEPFTLTDDDLARPEVRKRVEAAKAIALHPLEDEKKLAERLAELALVHKDANRAVLVFARGVETVEDVAKRLRKANANHVESLTGTMRGRERERLIETPVFRRFLPDPDTGDETVYLVCTSAGEVGVNISGDDLVCDLTTFESMAQRFGRVNRFGRRDDTRTDVVHPVEFGQKRPDEPARERTLQLLRELNGDGSPAALAGLCSARRSEAFSPQPEMLETSDILFDSWAMTTIRGEFPGRPPVEPYLHGIAEWEPPETRVAWREEVEVLDDSLRALYPPEDLLASYPLKPHELLKDRSDRVFQRLASLSRSHPKAPVWLVKDDGSVTLMRLADLADKDNKEEINGCTVILPPSVGGLKGGILTGDPDDEADDVADLWPDDDNRSRERVWSDDAMPRRARGMRLIRVIDTRPESDESGESEADGESTARKRYWHWLERPETADDDGSLTSPVAVPWKDHVGDVVRRTREIVAGLPLPENIARALIVAAEFHDHGKRRPDWQRSIGNTNLDAPLAKSGGKMRPIELNGYRHEFGSVLDLLHDPELQKLSEDEKDLALHFIAVHHGFGRPHFPPESAFDRAWSGEEADVAAIQVPMRYAHLQRRYGRWGLAYLESLLRAADYHASANPSRTQEAES